MILHAAVAPNAEDPAYIAEMKSDMEESLSKWDTLDNPSLKVASILDLNTREFIKDDHQTLLLPLVEAEIQRQDAISPPSPPSTDTTPDTPDSTPDHPPAKKQKLTGTAWIRAQLKPTPTDPDDHPISTHLTSVRQRALREVTRFLDMPTSEKDPLEWWTINAPQFPYLQNIARTYFAIQASGIPSERLWSTGGNVLHKKTARLSNLHFEAQVIMHLNFTKLRKLKQRGIKRKHFETIP